MSIFRKNTDNKEQKEKKRFNIGFGTMLFSIVFLYILFRVIIYVNNTDPVVFTVEQSTYNTDFTATGIAIRDEKIISSSTTGNACYYIRDGEKVSKGANIFAIDASGSMQSVMDDLKESGSELLSSTDYKDLTNQMKMFTTSFSESVFGDVYNFKTSLDNKLMELYEDMAMNKLGQTGSSGGSYLAEKAPYSGIVSYYEDGYENINVGNISSALFDRTTYSKRTLKSESQIAAGSPVCKLINDEEWKIAILLSEEEYSKVTDDEYATFTINNSNVKISTVYEKIEKADQHFIVVTFNKYMAEYVGQRFLDINFSFEESNGLKIPASSIVKKDAYMIPKRFLSGGSGDNELHFNQETKNEKGESHVEQIEPKVYFTDKKFCYVDSDDIPTNAVLRRNNSDETFSIATAAKYTMDGVLCVSRGTAQFKRIEIMVSGNDYYIVKPGISYGISRYDRILLDGSSMKEGDILY